MTENINYTELDFDKIRAKGERLESLIKLGNALLEHERRLPITFNDFLFQSSQQPEIIFRDIFQLFHDMIHHYIPEGIDDYPDKESIGFVNYQTDKLFIDNCDSPFFSDRLFANRLVNMSESFNRGTQRNFIYIFEGPPGSGKSTFLNNILQKFEDYSKTPEGSTWKVYWKLDIHQLGGFRNIERRFDNLLDELEKDTIDNGANGNHKFERMLNPDKYLEFSCPNHDHPILMIPKINRKDILNELIPCEEFKQKLFNDKAYEWVLHDIPCNICSSIFKTILDEVGDPMLVYSMINARKNFFNRQFGEGISVFNPGDLSLTKPITNPVMQNMINDLMKNDDVKFKFSYLAKTNNGILGLMDIKEYNIERLKNYHGIISDGVHKVELAEEHIKTLFLGLVNPEDKVHYEQIKSFQDRIISVKIPYVLDFNIEVAIYRNKFGDKIVNGFLPRVLENFAKIIIATRLSKDTPGMKKWIANPDKYKKYVDKSLLLLKMDIYTGKVPTWLSEDDIKHFDKKMRKEIIRDSESEGCKGISGRQSLNVFNLFYDIYESEENLITMENVRTFFTKQNEQYGKDIPEGFIDSLVDMYDYNVVQEVKESIYFYNETQISHDIQNYLFAVNFETGEKKKNPYTNETIEIDEDYFKNFEALFLGTTSTADERRTFRNDVRNEYISNTLTHEMRIDGKKISETTQFASLFEKYTRNLKEHALAQYSDNDNFRRAVIDFGTSSFNAYEERLKRDVKRLIANLITKFKYNEEGAKQVSVYVLDKQLTKKY